MILFHDLQTLEQRTKVNRSSSFRILNPNSQGSWSIKSRFKRGRMVHEINDNISGLSVVTKSRTVLCLSNESNLENSERKKSFSRSLRLRLTGDFIICGKIFIAKPSPRATLGGRTTPKLKQH